jgi:hypothetical protein
MRYWNMPRGALTGQYRRENGMRILLDHNTSAPLRYALQGHQVETAYEKG